MQDVSGQNADGVNTLIKEIDATSESAVAMHI